MVSAEQTPPPSTNHIALYLAQLELALQGRNPALVHDALVDAESHLRAAVAAGSTPQQAVEDFGAPEDIARAYVDADDPRRGLPRDAVTGAQPAPIPLSQTPLGAEQSASSTGGAAVAGGAATTDSDVVNGLAAGAASATVSATAPQPEPFYKRARRIPVLGVWFNPYAWGSLVFFTTVGFAFAVAVFVWVVTVGSISIGTLPILVGFLLLVLLLGSVRGLCLVDGILCEFFLGVRMPRRTQPVYTTSGISMWQRIGCWLRDLRSWLSLGYLLGNFPVAIALFVLFITLTVTSAVLIGVPIASIFEGAVIQSDLEPGYVFRGFGPDIVTQANGDIHLPAVHLVMMFACGLVLATCTLWLARGLGWVYGHVVQAIQVARPRAVLVRPVEQCSQPTQ